MRTAITTFLVLAALAGTAAAVPTTLSFTARLTDGATPVEGPVDLHVAVFDAPTAGTMVWEETHAGVVASRGLVYASLGGVDPVNNGIDASVFSGAPMFIELTVDGDVLSPRIPVASVPYAVKAGVAESLEGFDPGSIITGVTAGTGLTGGGAAGAVTLSVDTATIQSRVTGTCAAGTFITGVAANGTVTCGTDAVGTGDITDVTAGTGLTGGGAAGAITLSIATGGVTSTHLLDGTIAAIDVAADSLGAGQIATDGVGAAEIAANAVGTSEIAAGGVTTVDIAAGAVTMSKTDAPVGYAALNSSNGSSSVYPSGDITFAENGSCMVTVEAMDLGANASFRLRPLMLHVASNASVGPAQYVPSWYASDGQTQSGYFASATAVITTNQLGTWRIGCEMPGYGSSLNCRVSWLCN